MYYSCLFPARDDEPAAFAREMPEYFHDLNLDQIAEGAMRGFERFDLAPHYYTLIADDRVVRYRQDALRDLEKEEVFARAKSLCDVVAAVSRLLPGLRSSLRGEGPYPNSAMTRGRMLGAAVKYCAALREFAAEAGASSPAIAGFAAYLRELFETPGWKEFSGHTARVREAFDRASYCLLIKNSTIRLRKYEDQEDESGYIHRLFDKFAQGEGQEYRHSVNEANIAHHVESALLDLLAKMYPDEFGDLAALCAAHADFLDGTVERFALEMQFYFSYLAYIAPLRRAGMPFCFPEYVAEGRAEAAGSFDLALAHSRIGREMPVTNGFWLDPPERVLVVTGPNQGGKTTFARSIGQTAHLGRTGLCVPGAAARLRPTRAIFTHFEKEENVENGAGKLMDDLVRIRPMLEAGGSDSLFIINEIFASTTLEDAARISRRVMEKLVAIGAQAVWVTFIDEMASFGPETVSMMSTVEDGDDRRTFRIVRRAADGLAHAMTIARRHALTYEQLMGRLKA